MPMEFPPPPATLFAWSPIEMSEATADFAAYPIEMPLLAELFAI